MGDMERLSRKIDENALRVHAANEAAVKARAAGQQAISRSRSRRFRAALPTTGAIAAAGESPLRLGEPPCLVPKAHSDATDPRAGGWPFTLLSAERFDRLTVDERMAYLQRALAGLRALEETNKTLNKMRESPQ